MITSSPLQPIPPPISTISNFNNSRDKTSLMPIPSSSNSLALVDQTSANEDHNTEFQDEQDEAFAQEEEDHEIHIRRDKDMLFGSSEIPTVESTRNVPPSHLSSILELENSILNHNQIHPIPGMKPRDSEEPEENLETIDLMEELDTFCSDDENENRTESELYTDALSSIDDPSLNQNPSTR